MASVSRPPISAALRREVLADGALCGYCREVPADTIDHIVPVSRGGLSVRENLVAACGRCNSRKGTRASEGFDPGRRLTPSELAALSHAAQNVRTWTDRRNQLIRSAYSSGALRLREIAKATRLNVGTVHTMLHGRRR